MLKFLGFIFFLIPLCLNKHLYWMVQNMVFMLLFFGCLMFEISENFCNLSYYFMLDQYSFSLIYLTGWVSALMLMASSHNFFSDNNISLFMLNVVILFFILIFSFSVYNLLLYYVFFESSLIPTMFLILGWGYQPERLQAGVYLLFYTLAASLPLLMGIFYIHFFLSLNYFLFFVNFSSGLMYLVLVIAFLVKMPMFLVHLWLPKAHVEAPISGSMILAAILLKLGGYGLMRVLVLIQGIGMSWNFIWVSVSLVGGGFISLLCLYQTDLKVLIAYSSVAHMSLVIGGIMSMTMWGMGGAYCLMIAHGLCSSGLFCLANIVYERMGSRSLYVNKGMMNFLPSLALWWFLLSSANMAAPPTLNLLSEITLINVLINWSWLSMIFLAFISFFSAAYTLFLYSYTQHGMAHNGVLSYSFVSIREFLLLFLHWIPLNILILKSDLFI
uniref:NADH dehydrogenase subunit 4 n=1 Tax=Puliciphora borinquenensis TaxID=92546 RepID=UPI001D1238F6|nr:NADH dehydrogenase subunit 4 [Puliciphora borinquenensis]QZL38258.1 NADH dehydrogenase subunit 4 [Puliciphora borinquenensis]